MNLTTSYLGLTLAHPFMAGASPLSADLNSVRRLEDAGCAAIVLHSLFEEQITMTRDARIHHRDPLDQAFAASLAAFPPASQYPFDLQQYFRYLTRVKEAVAIPVIASLNGMSAESWLREAVTLQQAGAWALELNMYHVITDLHASGIAVETRLRDLVVELKRLLHIPVVVKLAPFYTALGNLASRLDEAGADGLVLFNRFYQPDIDIDTLSVVPSVELSHSSDLLLRLRWLAILYRRITASLAVSGGVSTPEDGIKALLAGADAVQLVSAILRHGPTYFRTMQQGLERWMERQRFNTVDEFRGHLSLQATEDPESFERANYIRVLHSWNG